MDNYQAIYDAVRSRLGNADVGEAIREAIRVQNWTHYVEQAAYAWQLAAAQQERPSVVFKPRIFMDGSAFCALLGDNIQEGVAAFGDSPAEAAASFDAAWYKKEKQRG